MKHLIPIHLTGYDWFTKIEEWRAEDKDTKRRHWTLSPYGKGFRIHLTWNMDGQCASLEKIAPSAEECIWLAINESQKSN